MRCSRRTALGLSFAMVSLLTLPAAARECEDVSMPDSVNLDGVKLVLNGMGVREATVFNVNVYVAGLYLQKRSSDGKKIAEAEEPKQMLLAFVRNVSKTDMAEAIQKGFQRAAGDGYAKLKLRVERFMAALPEFKKGDRLTLSYRPNVGLELKTAAQLTRIEGADFARALFMIWLGPNPPNAGLKKGLLGGACG
ncbi:MAG: chalcone isomerase family protein [Polyangiaceae bacterium]